MIKPLRNTHRQVWLLFALLLPAGIIAAWLVIPNPVAVKSSAIDHYPLLQQVVAKKETRQYCLNLRCDKERTNWQLEWKNKLPLTVPSAVIYYRSKLIGRIEARGDYIFPIDCKTDSNVRLVLYDFIHDQIIDSINLTIL